MLISIPSNFIKHDEDTLNEFVSQVNRIRDFRDSR